MRIKKVDSNYPGFRSITFNPDFSIIAGDSQEKKTARAHNLGKSSIIRIIRFVLFNDSKTFVNKLIPEKEDLEFEVDLEDFEQSHSYFRNMKRRKKGDFIEIDTLIDYEYFIRFQNEFDLESPFRKEKFRGSDLTWKPRLIGLLGFNEELFAKKLIINAEIKELKDTIKIIGKSDVSFEKNEDRINVLRKEVDEHKNALSELNLLKADKINIDNVISELDVEINDHEMELFRLQKEQYKIESSLKALEKQKFNLNDVKEIYNEARVYFSESLSKEINELEEFYKAVFENRKKVLLPLKKENAQKLLAIEKLLENKNTLRNGKLNSLLSKDSIEKYKQLSQELLGYEKELFLLERDIIGENIEELKSQLSKKETESFRLSAEVAEEIDNNRNKFEEICAIYSKILKDAINIVAKIEIVKRSTGNLDLQIKSYRGNVETDELKGATAKRISSAAVDIAIRAVQNEDNGFIIQDGVIDEIDSNAAEQFIKIIRSLVRKYNFQYIMTAIKDRLPKNVDEQDIVINLNDYNNEGLLFGRRF